MCEGKRFFWQSPCKDCQKLFKIVQEGLGKMGLSQLMDELIATGLPKPKIQRFLESDPYGKGSLMDQIVAQLTNNLAEGIGVKGDEMTAEDVKTIRDNPQYGASTKPLEE